MQRLYEPIPVAVQSRTQDCRRLTAEIADSNSAESIVAHLLCQLCCGGRTLCDELITRSEKSYRVWASKRRRPKKKKTSGDLRLKIYMQATHLFPFYFYIQSLMMGLMDGKVQFIGNSFLLHNKYMWK